jgi:hypothetical protein
MVDPTGDPLLQLLFLWDADELAVWVRAEHDHDLWVIQELREQADGEWQLDGPARWHDVNGASRAVPKRIARRTGLDQQLARIGPTLERYRAFVMDLPPDAPEAKVGRELIERLDAIEFRARTRRGGTIEPVDDLSADRTIHQAEQRRRRREGRERLRLSADELAFYRLLDL